MYISFENLTRNSGARDGTTVDFTVLHCVKKEKLGENRANKMDVLYAW